MILVYDIKLGAIPANHRIVISIFILMLFWVSLGIDLM